jgi:chaperonin GroEL
MNRNVTKNTVYTEIKTGEELRAKFVSGSEQLRDVVETTMGAKGLYVVHSNGSPFNKIHNDGVTVINDMLLEDKFEELAAKALREASQKTNTEAGDFTTGTAVLGANMIIEGAQLINTNSIDPLK